MDVQQANLQAAAIQAAIESQAISRSQGLTDLHALADQVAATAPTGAAGIFYSGNYRTVGGQTLHSSVVAEAIANASNGTMVRLDDVPIGAFLNGDPFREALTEATRTGSGNLELDRLAFENALERVTHTFLRAATPRALDLSTPPHRSRPAKTTSRTKSIPHRQT